MLVPPSTLLTDSQVTTPPEVELDAMTKAYIDQTGNVGMCNADKASIRQWIKEQLEIYHVD